MEARLANPGSLQLRRRLHNGFTAPAVHVTRNPSTTLALGGRGQATYVIAQDYIDERAMLCELISPSINAIS